jgi:hypothetical protein
MFKSVELAHLEETGQLRVLMSKFRGFTSGKLIASGGDATVFDYDGGCVAKICSKKIRYFKHFGSNNSAESFKRHINELYPFFLPVVDILYEDLNVFVYTQKKCQMLNTKSIDNSIVIDILRLIQFMIINNVILTDLAPHNLGLININGQLQTIIFDYHGLHPLSDESGDIKRAGWWRRLARNMTRFVSALYVPEKRKHYGALMQNCDSIVLLELQNEKSIPVSFTNLLTYLSTYQNKAEIDQICLHIDLCVEDLKKAVKSSKSVLKSKNKDKTKLKKSKNKSKNKSKKHDKSKNKAKLSDRVKSVSKLRTAPVLKAQSSLF